MEILITIFSLIVLLFSVMIHEIAHGQMAYLQGDPTAKYEGRLTLNPLKHLDPFGSILLPLLLLIATAGQGPIFGWAKPVPVNPYNFKDQKWGTLKVSIAGPATNFLIAIFFGLLIRVLDNFVLFTHGAGSQFINLLAIITIYNFLWGIFNLVPIPPLDGSWILFRFLPESTASFKAFMQQYGLFILIFFIFFGGLSWLSWMAQFLYSIFTGAAFLAL